MKQGNINARVRTVAQTFNADGNIRAEGAVSISIFNAGTTTATVYGTLDINAGASPLVLEGNITGAGRNEVLTTVRDDDIPLTFSGAGTNKVVVLKTIIIDIKACQ